MKKFVALLLIFTAHLPVLNAQLTDIVQPSTKPAVNSEFLFQRGENQKAGAFLLVGFGVGLTIAGHIIDKLSDDRDSPWFPLTSYLDIGTGKWIMLAGETFMVVSMTFFISSGYNKKRARIMVKNVSAVMSTQLHFKENFVSVTTSFDIDALATR